MAPLLLQLPVEIEEPLDRLRAVHRRVADLRAGREVAAGARIAERA